MTDAEKFQRMVHDSPVMRLANSEMTSQMVVEQIDGRESGTVALKVSSLVKFSNEQEQTFPHVVLVFGPGGNGLVHAYGCEDSA